MKTRDATKRSRSPNSRPTEHSHSHARKLVVLLLLLMLSATVQAQFEYTVDEGKVTIIQYTGPGGAVTIPDTISGLPVTSIGFAAFDNRTSLTSLTIPDSVTSIRAVAFNDCASLTSVTIGNHVTVIEGGAFRNCTGLTSIAIPDSVTSILSSTGMDPMGTFQGCTSLITVTIGKGVSTIGQEAFWGCNNLETFDVAVLNPAYSSLEGVLFDQARTALILCPQGKTGTYTIPDGVKVIEGGAFRKCTGLTGVTIPEGVTSIRRLIGNNPRSYDPIGAFEGCTSLTSVMIPDSVTELGDAAFSGCTGLANVTIGNGVTRIGLRAFSRCTSLTGFPTGSRVATIESHAFTGCTALTKITIPESVTMIKAGAFADCTSLTSVTIPKSVTKVLSYDDSNSLLVGAFDGCRSLGGVYFRGNAPSTDAPPGYEVMFQGADNVTVYYLPGTTGWGPQFEERPTAVWPDPVIVDGTVAIRANVFGFAISWTPDAPVVVEASSTVSNPTWSPVSTNVPAGVVYQFSDPDWVTYPARFYRVRSE